MVLDKTLNIKGRVRVTDPCYEPDIWCGISVDVLAGEWKCKVIRKTRVDRLIIRHEDYPKVLFNFIEPIGYACVDSGQCGFFNESYYQQNWFKDEWYKRCCDFTLSASRCGVLDEDGVVSESGDGDGEYPVLAAKNEQGEIVGLMIDFSFSSLDEIL